MSERVYCETCHGPVMGLGRIELAFSHICYWLWMRLPLSLALSRPIEQALLPWVGNVAFGCSCRDKNGAAKTGDRP